MGKVGSGFVLVIALIMVLSACSPANQTPVEPVLPEVTQAENAPVDSMSASASPTTGQEEPTSSPSETPTEIPPTPTSTAPTGSLSLVGQYGYGTGFPFSGRQIQLSADEQSLIVTTTAGIFTFSAEDLSPQLAIHEPFGLYPYYRNIRISRDGTQAVAAAYSSMGDLVLRVWDLATGDLLNEYTIYPG